MAGYGWDEYDARTGGQQVIHDDENKLDIHTQFAKIPGGQYGGSWGARISGTLRPDVFEEVISTVVFYVGLEGFGSVGVTNDFDPLGYEEPVVIEGSTQELGAFKIEITDEPGTENAHPPRAHASYDEKPLDRTMVKSLMVGQENLWQAKRMLPGSLSHRDGACFANIRFGGKLSFFRRSREVLTNTLKSTEKRTSLRRIRSSPLERISLSQATCI